MKDFQVKDLIKVYTINILIKKKKEYMYIFAT